jgi:FkbM family methyltransferase
MKNIYKFMVVAAISLSVAIPGYNWYRRHPDGERRSRSYVYALERYILQRKHLIAKSIYGSQFKFKTKDVVGRSIYKGRNYEPDLTKFVLQKISYNDGDVVLDVGANLGWYSINIDTVHPTKKLKILAFEPDDVNFSLLKDNAKLNKADIILVNKALAEQTGQQILYKYAEHNLGRHSLLKENNNQKQIMVNTTTLDNVLDEYQLQDHKIKLLKIDVEGYEYQVLLGASNVLNNVENIIQEFSPSVMRDNNIDPENLIKLLVDNNFEPFFITNNGDKIVSADLNNYLYSTDALNVLWKKKVA